MCSTQPAKPTPSNPSANETLQVSDIRVSPRYAGMEASSTARRQAGYESDFYNQFLVSPGLAHHRGSPQTLDRVAALPICHQRIEPMLQPSYVLEGTVNALYGDFRNPNSPGAVLEMEFFLTGEIPGNSGLLMQKRYVKSVPLAARTPDALVKGWNQALEEILSALVTDLKTVSLKDAK